MATRRGARGILRSAAMVGLALPAAQAAYAAIVRLLIRRAVARMRAGDLRPLMRLYSRDVHFVFPGNNSWAVDLHSREEFEAWVQRLVDAELELELDRILVSGPPWNTALAITFTDQARGHDGSIVYSNQGAITGTARWGRVIAQRDNLDTERVAAWDAYLQREGAGRLSSPLRA